MSKVFPIPTLDHAEVIRAIGILCGEPNWAPKAKVDDPKSRAWLRRELWPTIAKSTRFQFHLTPTGGLGYTGEVTIQEMACFVQLQDIIIGLLSGRRPGKARVATALALTPKDVAELLNRLGTGSRAAFAKLAVAFKVTEEVNLTTSNDIQHALAVVNRAIEQRWTNKQRDHLEAEIGLLSRKRPAQATGGQGHG